MELINLVNSVIIFLSQRTLLRWLTFLLRPLIVTLKVLLFWIYLFLLTLVFVLQWLSFHWEILIMLFSQFPLTFCQTQNWWIAIRLLNKGKSLIPPLFNSPEVLSSASDKPKLLAKIFSKNSNLDDLGTSLPVFPSRTNLKMHISLTFKMVKNLDSSRASGPDCIPVVVLRSFEPELSYIPPELNMCLKESYFPDCWKISLVVLVFKNVGEKYTAKNYCPTALDIVWQTIILIKRKFYGISGHFLFSQ